MSKKQIALLGCSDGRKQSARTDVEALTGLILTEGFAVRQSAALYRDAAGNTAPAALRAAELQRFFAEADCTDLLDLSGGDAAHEILPLLDYDAIAKSRATLWGYSDLTCVLNALYTMTGKRSVLYQARNILACEGMRQPFFDALCGRGQELFSFPYRFVQGQKMQGILLGGNLRCLLKLAGTPYFPPLEGCILLLEARSGDCDAITALLQRLAALGAFEKAAGILLGTFTEWQSHPEYPPIETVVQKLAGEHLPIAKTEAIGHGKDSAAVRIGAYYELKQ